jgi:hypothetical protein
MCPSLIKNSGNLRSKSNYPVPTSEIKKDVPSDTKTPWPLWLTINNNAEVAKCYNIVVNRILSNIEGSSLDHVENVLRHEFCFPIEVIHSFIKFIITTPTKDIIFEEKNNCRLPIIYRHPRENIKLVGAFSRFIPDEKLQVEGRGSK